MLEQEQKKQQPQIKHRFDAKGELEPLVWANFESVLHTVDDVITGSGSTSLADYKKKNADKLCDRENRSTLLTKTEHRLDDFVNKKGTVANSWLTD